MKNKIQSSNIQSIVLTKFKKLEEAQDHEHYSSSYGSFTTQKGIEILPENNRTKKLARSLSFSSILSTRKGKLKISKGDESTRLKIVEENSELTSFCDTLKRNRTLKEKMLNQQTLTETSMRRLSIVCNEIEKFEREFVEPVRKSSSTISLAFNSTTSSQGMRKHSSVNVLSVAEKMPWKYLSSDSVATSGYSSAGLSRESTPDLSLRSEVLTETDVEQDKKDKSTDFQINSSNSRNKPFCSTPRKPKRSLSEKLVSRPNQHNFIRRSHSTTTACGDSRRQRQSDCGDSRRQRQSGHQPQHIFISLGCSGNCRSKVTVNGLCYH